MAFLNSSGYQAIGCLGAEQAYDAMYDTVFDLIVSDIMMPGIDGFEFAKTVRSLNEDIPILFMTPRDDFAAKQRGYRIGVDDYMVKPIDLDELFLRIGALILGTGISFAITDLGKLLEMHSQFAMLIGIVIGIVGLVLVALAYPVYNRILRKERQRIAPEILRLTDELMQ